MGKARLQCVATTTAKVSNSAPEPPISSVCTKVSVTFPPSGNHPLHSSLADVVGQREWSLACCRDNTAQILTGPLKGRRTTPTYARIHTFVYTRVQSQCQCGVNSRQSLEPERRPSNNLHQQRLFDYFSLYFHAQQSVRPIQNSNDRRRKLPRQSSPTSFAVGLVLATGPLLYHSYSLVRMSSSDWFQKIHVILTTAHLREVRWSAVI